MTTEARSPVKVDVPSGLAHLSRAVVVALYLLALIIIFASAVVLTIVLQATAYFWPLTLLGAFVIAALVSAAALPYLQQKH